MNRDKHPNKHIEAALSYAEENGWTIEKGSRSSHCWGKMFCPTNSKCRNGVYCIKSIWSTPRNPTNHAKGIKGVVIKCENRGTEDDF